MESFLDLIYLYVFTKLDAHFGIVIALKDFLIKM